MCIDGTVWDHCFASRSAEYRPIGGGAYLPILPGPANSLASVINDPIAHWNTLSVADGDYTIRITGISSCQGGSPASFEASRNVTVDNTAPIAVITSPASCQSVQGVIPIIGTAADAHMGAWRLLYAGGAAHDWVFIAGGSTSVVNGVLGQWNTAGLIPCAYVLRLVVYDAALLDCGPQTHVTEYTVLVDLGHACDINHDGSANGLDVQPFVSCILSGP